MPNICENLLILSHPSKESWEAFKKAFSKHYNKKSNDPPFFDTIIPMPPNLLDDDSWYDWRWEHWGTKWDAFEIEVNAERTIWKYHTAWQPPLQIYRHLSSKQFDVTAYYIVEGMEYVGKWMNRKHTSNEIGDIRAREVYDKLGHQTHYRKDQDLSYSYFWNMWIHQEKYEQQKHRGAVECAEKIYQQALLSIELSTEKALTAWVIASKTM